MRALLLYTENRGPMLADSVTYRTLSASSRGCCSASRSRVSCSPATPSLPQALIHAVDAAIPGLVGEDGLIDPSLDRGDPVGLTLTTVLSIIGLVGAAIGAIGSLRVAFRALADNLNDDIFFDLGARCAICSSRSESAPRSRHPLSSRSWRTPASAR